ncbi:hypothetical protein HPB49_023223 [Dermacentor silvarum]|uniref:Uncharacterized protein n=1 Tax=Dermacentor silvarum TaxID=543639 RepID=A0ACB8CHY9_DERSI|nr:hypothetical protein HPB49_023223 [Dermacentor silvarum]
MPGLNWAEVDAATVAYFSTEFLQSELIRRGIDATGSRDDLIQRLTACLEEARAAIPKQAPRPASAPVSSTSVQFPASHLTPTVYQAIPDATSQVYAPASYVPPPPWSYPTPPLVCDAAAVPTQVFSPPQEPQPFVTAPRQNNGTTPSRQVSSASLMPSTAPPTVSFKKSRVPPSRPASPPHSRRITDLPPAEQEARYSALSQRYGVPAFRPGQSLSEAVCFKCHEKGHLASKCPTKQETVTQQPATTSTSLHAAAPALHTSPLEDVHGSHLECSFFTADIAILGSYDAFPDTGTKITIVTKSAIKNLPLMPWTREPLAVVGGSSVHPEGTVCLKITVGPITALVEAAVISNNVLPVILGEDWFRASNTRLVFEPLNSS